MADIMKKRTMKIQSQAVLLTVITLNEAHCQSLGTERYALYWQECQFRKENNASA